MPSIIHETVLKDIIDIISDTELLKNIKNSDRDQKQYKFSSLTRNANNLILVFPVLCTKGISIETASMISKAIEKNCVNLLEMLFSSVQFSNVENLSDYISKFHRNISIGSKIDIDDIDDFISFTNRIADEATNESGSIRVTDRAVFEAFQAGMKEINNNITKLTLNENSLSNFACHRTTSGYETILEVGNKKDKEEKFTETPDNARLIEKHWSDNDLKKANELMPTKVVVNFYSTSAGEKFSNGIIGVKCKLYPVDSMEIIERISSKYADTNWIKEFVRATTGEISFLRDFVFALDKARVDAINSAKKGSSAKMFKVLEKRATKNRLSKWKANRVDSSPITTLVVSQEEVEYLKKEYSIDLENRSIATKLMDEYNFMGVTIVDEPSETASFIWDEGNDAAYETLSFRNLERESDDKNYRKVINLMTKISR